MHFGITNTCPLMVSPLTVLLLGSLVRSKLEGGLSWFFLVCAKIEETVCFLQDFLGPFVASCCNWFYESKPMCYKKNADCILKYVEYFHLFSSLGESEG